VKQLLPNRIIYKTLLLLLVIMTFFSAVIFHSMYKNNLHFSEEFIEAQREILKEQITKEKHELFEWEQEHIRSHAGALVSLIQKSLAAHFDKEMLQDILRIFMNQKNIRTVSIYDGKSDAVYLGLTKNSHGHLVALKIQPENRAGMKKISYPLTVNGSAFGGVDIYYSLDDFMEHVEEELKELESKNYALFDQKADDLRGDLQRYFLNNFVLFIVFLLTMLVVTALIFTRYVHHPLQVLHENLQQFFAFFHDPTIKFQPKVLSGQDEFSQMSSDINTHIQSVLKLYQEVNTTQKEILVTIGTIAEKHSLETKNHVRRVAGYAEILGRYAGLSESEVTLLRDASTLHDLGKVAIPDTILKKPGPLSEEEYAVMQTHTVHGYEMLRHSHRPLLKAAAIIAYEHHERYDGTGYPRGLLGESIHIYGRIVALADVFDALGSERVYKQRWNDEEILEKIRTERGKQFDPKLVDIFFEHYDEFLLVRKQFYDDELIF